LQDHYIELLLIFLMPALIPTLHLAYFVWLPRRAIKKYGQRDPERLRRYLERVVATPSLLGPGMKLVARLALVGIYFGRGQHAEAAAHCRENLKALESTRSSRPNEALEADIRRRLADSLEALGHPEEAAQERGRAARQLGRAEDDTLRFLTHGTLLERQNRHEDAYAAFQKALELTPASNKDVRVECLVHLTLAAHRVGRPTECLQWAEDAIAAGAKGKILRSAHRMAGVACGNLSRLDECEQHYRQAYDISTAENDKADIAEDLGTLASCLKKRGKLAEAYEMCTKAAAMDPKGVSMSLAVQKEILRAWGRYDESLALYARLKEGRKVVLPQAERRLSAVRLLDRSRTEAECGRAAEAWTHVQEARDVLKDDPKLGLRCEAVVVHVLAIRGLTDESRRLADEVEPRLADFESDPSTCCGVYCDLALAAGVRGDHAEGIDCWTRYLALGPDPVYQPTALYFRAESHRQLGQQVSARQDYRAAVDLQLDTYHARLAQRRLGETEFV
jgi:tetratricopeptide (TPR) repeat protein